MGDFYPWGPHGPRSDHPNVIPNPTPVDTVPKFEAWQPTVPSLGGGGSYSGSTALPRNPGKSVLMGILLTAIFGPLGLFYASKKGALAMLVAWFGLSMLMSLPGSPAAQPGAPSPALWIEVAFQVLWPLAAAGSVVLSVVAVIAHNKKLARLAAQSNP